MRNITIKDDGLKIDKKVATIRIEWDGNSIPEKQLKALAILLGAYNKYGRAIDLEVHRDRISKFGDILTEIESDI